MSLLSGRACALWCFVLLISTPYALARQRRETFTDEDDIVNSLRHSITSLRPNSGGGPVEVGISVYLLFVSISTADMTATFDMYFRQKWKDPRLATSDGTNLHGRHVANPAFLKKIWKPDVFFANSHHEYLHKEPTRNEMLRISDNGEILRSSRISVAASCPMNLQYYPWDTQICALEIESFAFSNLDVTLYWSGGSSKAVQVDPAVSTPSLRFVGKNTKTIIAQTTTGNYSRLMAEFRFVRSGGRYFASTYIPAIFAVILSWLPFWLDESAVSSRALIGAITTLFTASLFVTSTDSSLPQISYFTSVDIFLLICVLFVLMTLVEFMLLTTLSKKEYDWVSRVDTASRILFPVCFTLFLLSYFLASTSDQNIEGFE